MPYLFGGWSGRKDPRGRLIDGEAATWKPDMETARADCQLRDKDREIQHRGIERSSEKQAEEMLPASDKHVPAGGSEFYRLIF